MEYNHLKLIFFRDLIESQRIEIYKYFGYEEILVNQRLDRFIETIFLIEMYDQDKRWLEEMVVAFKEHNNDRNTLGKV